MPAIHSRTSSAVPGTGWVRRRPRRWPRTRPTPTTLCSCTGAGAWERDTCSTPSGTPAWGRGRPPKALVTLEERLRSRFEWGLTADIQPPDLETRLAILRTKAERAGRQVAPGLLEVIARKVQSNLRELEGALTRVLAMADLSGMPLNQDLVETALVDLLPRGGAMTPETILAAVAGHFNISREH